MNKLVNFILLIIIYLIILFYFDNFSLLTEVRGFIHQQEYVKPFIYMIVNLFAIISIIFLFNNENKYIKYGSYLLVFISLVIVAVYRQIDENTGFGYVDALNILQLLKTFVVIDAASAYSNYIFHKILVVLIGLGVIFYINRKANIKFDVRYSSLFFISIGLIYGIIYISNANRLAFPSVYKVIDLLLYSYKNQLYIGKREKVSLRNDKNNSFNIVLIVDESIRGDYLTINGYDKNTTPYLNKIKDSIFNYGIASSGGVCSNYSEYILLSGVQPNILPDTESISRKEPVIFQYAKKALYHTSLIDIMINKNNNRHFLMKNDFNYIDKAIDLSKVCDTKIYKRDFCGISKLSDFLKKYNKSFVYIVKYGAHFHYENTYPKNEKIFQPTQNPNEWKWDIKDKEKFLNSYRNSIHWTVNEYLKQLINKLKDSNTLVIYTSDHAQNLMDDLSIQQTHCAKGKAPVQMAMVPLILIPMNNKIKQYIKKIYVNNYNRASHFNIFGSILYLMGYDKKQINKHYGKILFDKLSGKNRIFTSGDIFGRSHMYKNRFKVAK